MCVPVLRIALLVLAGFIPWQATRAGVKKGFRFDGDKFTCKDENLSFGGILVKPDGNGPFPAILISHGLGGNGERFGRSKAREYVKLGFVCMAPDYAHSDPKGNRKDFGASAENVRRANKCLDFLRSLPEVDAKQICAYGNSMGAFLTIGLAAEAPDRLAAAAITAGGVVPKPGFAAPSETQAAKIKVPFLILHGSADTTVPPQRSKLLEDVLKVNKVTCERRVFEGVGHDLHAAQSAEVNGLIVDWFRKHAKP
jgi:dienelactone hydrolase